MPLRPGLGAIDAERPTAATLSQIRAGGEGICVHLFAETATPLEARDATGNGAGPWRRATAPFGNRDGRGRRALDPGRRSPAVGPAVRCGRGRLTRAARRRWPTGNGRRRRHRHLKADRAPQMPTNMLADVTPAP
jgi:hypothetical protein